VAEGIGGCVTLRALVGASDAVTEGVSVGVGVGVGVADKVNPGVTVTDAVSVAVPVGRAVLVGVAIPPSAVTRDARIEGCTERPDVVIWATV
jgi:hypothetical protein